MTPYREIRKQKLKKMLKNNFWLIPDCYNALELETSSINVHDQVSESNAPKHRYFHYFHSLINRHRLMLPNAKTSGHMSKFLVSSHVLQLLPSASWRYFWPTSLRYSSMALVPSVFSRNIKCSFSPHLSTSDIIRSVRKSWMNTQTSKQVNNKVPFNSH